MTTADGPVTTRLLLVRHGESRAQVDRVIGGDTGCTGLSTRGMRQVEALRDRWATAGATADALLSSTLPRAVETADILAAALGLAVKTDADLVEWRPGECDGMSWDEYVERYRFDVLAHPHTPLSPGGESLAEFLLRAGACLHRLTREHAGETVVIACHGGIVEASLRSFLGLPSQGLRTFDLATENASVTEWQATGGPDDVLRWRLRRYGDAAHLEGLV